MDTKILEDIGMSNIEIKVFLSLLEEGESKAGKIIENTGMQSSSIYIAINSLIGKGLVSYVKKGNVKFYKAADPETLLEYLEVKKKEFLEILPELKERQKKKEESEIEFFKSVRGIKTLISELFKDAKKGDIQRYFAISDPETYKETVDKVYSSRKRMRIEKGIYSKGIFHPSIKPFLHKSKLAQKRFLDFAIPPNTIIINNKVAIISWKEKEPFGVLIKSESIAKEYAAFFEQMWKLAKR